MGSGVGRADPLTRAGQSVCVVVWCESGGLLSGIGHSSTLVYGLNAASAYAVVATTWLWPKETVEISMSRVRYLQFSAPLRSLLFLQTQRFRASNGGHYSGSYPGMLP